MRKYLLLLMALLAFSALFTACASDVAPSGDDLSEEEQFEEAVNESVSDEEMVGDEEYVEIGEMI